MYQHEFEKNAIVGDDELALDSYFTTQNVGYPTGGVGDSQQGVSRYTRLTRIEPDFLMEGDMYGSVIGYEFAQNPPNTEIPFTLGPESGKIDLRAQRRHLMLKFGSNTLNGFFEAGKVIIHTEPGDNRS